ncbi:hypothetical protein [Dehalobacter sp.]|uniref:hypothetical protein n=1 Tax=Dehalobacter sp. TaxID=1962289 RepID=UPI002586E2C9|nr:hypothetical protein [Dehalobacter sp.]MDJ0304551.1 hypothetical protein [Dehalobacter sp.]
MRSRNKKILIVVIALILVLTMGVSSAMATSYYPPCYANRYLQVSETGAFVGGGFTSSDGIDSVTVKWKNYNGSCWFFEYYNYSAFGEWRYFGHGSSIDSSSGEQTFTFTSEYGYRIQGVKLEMITLSEPDLSNQWMSYVYMENADTSFGDMIFEVPDMSAPEYPPVPTFTSPSFNVPAIPSFGSVPGNISAPTDNSQGVSVGIPVLSPDTDMQIPSPGTLPVFSSMADTLKDIFGLPSTENTPDSQMSHSNENMPDLSYDLINNIQDTEMVRDNILSPDNQISADNQMIPDSIPGVNGNNNTPDFQMSPDEELTPD